MEECLYKIRDKKTGLYFSGKANSMWKMTKKGRSWTRLYDARETLNRLREEQKKGKCFYASNRDIDLTNLEVVEFKLTFSKICD